MFGLWYLSLAIDELRQYLGWSSIFDVFKGAKTGASTSNKSIEDKKPTQSANDIQPKVNLKPAPEPPKPVVVEKPKVVPEPPKPVAPEPPKPVEVPKPEPPKPVVAPAKPAPIEIPKPAPELPKPVASPQKPVTPPKSPSPPKQPTPVKQVTPPVTPPVELPKKEPSPPQPKPAASPSTPTKNELNNGESNLFNPSKKLENGGAAQNTNARSHLKDATTSFLQEEGKPGSQPVKQQQQPTLPSAANIDFKQL